MAKPRKTVEKVGLTKPLQEQSITVAVAVDDGSYDPTYANYVLITRSQFEFELQFARIPTKFTEDQLANAKEGSAVSIPALAKVVLPFAVFADMADLMVKQVQVLKEMQDAATKG